MSDYILGAGPRTHVEIPATVAALANGWELEPVWVNEAGGVTFELSRGEERRFLKWASTHMQLDLAAEGARCLWAAQYTPVPRVLEQGRDDTGQWLITAALEGENAVSEGWLPNPQVAVVAIGEGLRQLHALPTGLCPFTWSLDQRIHRAHARGVDADLQRWPEFRNLSLEAALMELDAPPPIDQLVVCHGDPCAPNTLIDANGRCSGRVDLGSLGVADRWADLAVATWSSVWNYGPGWEEKLLEAYGIAPDPVRTRYYRLLWALT